MAKVDIMVPGPKDWGTYRVLGRDVGTALVKLAKAARKLDSFLNRRDVPADKDITAAPLLFVDSDGRCYLFVQPKQPTSPPPDPVKA